MPWFAEVNLGKTRRDDEKIVLKFNYLNFLGLFCGGCLDMGVNLATILGFQLATKSNINGGILGVAVSSNVLLVTALSYCLFKEKV